MGSDSKGRHNRIAGNDIGGRLREERKKFNLNQGDFAKLADFSRNAQAMYERDETAPGARYLVRLAEIGADVLYILTGNRSASAGEISNEELELIQLYRSAPLVVKAAALAALSAGSSASNTVSVTSQGDRVAGRVYNENKK
ncbi:helix-turn-helix domain-containing protein [Serratia sp. PAMC26656]|uniref:helix-turn-helix domain-containing protein n=1 Tax=Serratia sp. PAMC26656 TaxID=2775909 RepID=UPI0018F66181|nr:helix-turn-helix domain-containing protein [Serratia sp. PAMC26656]MBJ7892394.1 helix-turn-helix domain-containing protein [Serratia sp. PAMC26656]